MISENCKIFVGTLYSGENEFNKCLESINKQRNVSFQHFVYKYLPNKEAHDKLFTDFIKSDFDILIKVDADTVLKDEHVFKKYIDAFRNNKDIQWVSFTLLDFFQKRPIWGLNAYRNNIKIFDNGEVYVDQIVDYDKYLKKDEIVGYHSFSPTNYQSFHFGFHRQLKNQKAIYHVFKAFSKTFNYKRALVMLGALDVIFGKLSISNNVSYHDRYLLERFRKYEKLDKLFLKIYVLAFFGVIHYPKKFFIKFLKQATKTILPK
jgi:hypothetical protein